MSYEPLTVAPVGLNEEFVRLENLLREAIRLESVEIEKLENPLDVEVGESFLLGMRLGLDTVMNEMGLSQDLAELSTRIWDILIDSDADGCFYITETAIAIYDGKREIFELASANAFAAPNQHLKLKI